jgi:hypothetical protein
MAGQSSNGGNTVMPPPAQGWSEQTAFRGYPWYNAWDNGFFALERWDGNAPPCDGGPISQSVCATDDLSQGDDVQMIWRASSGGKTSKIMKYTVQDGGEDITDRS